MMRFRLFALLLAFSAAPSCAEERLQLVTFEFAPYVREDASGKLSGISVEIVTEAFARIKQPISIDLYPPARAVARYENKEVDGLFTIKMTPERKRVMLFPTHPVIRQDFVFLGRKDSPSPFIGDLSTLSTLRIGVVTGLTYGDRFTQALRAGLLKTEGVTTLEQNIRKLLAQRIDLVVSSRLVAMQAVRELGADALIEVKGPPIETLPSYLGLQLGKHEAIARKFDQAIDEMQKDGTLRKIEERHERSARP